MANSKVIYHSSEQMEIWLGQLSKLECHSAKIEYAPEVQIEVRSANW